MSSKSKVQSSKLTARQLQVCRRWVVGNVTMKVIAAELGIAFKTVDKHVGDVMRIMGRRGVHNQLGLLHWMVRKGYVQLSEVYPGVWPEV